MMLGDERNGSIKSLLTYLRCFSWRLDNAGQMPLCSDLDAYLPMPEIGTVTVLWPRKYSWEFGTSRLDSIKRELCRLPFVRLELVDIDDFALDWRRKGGFPVPTDKLHLIGAPGHPKDPNDIRGEIFEVHGDDRARLVAYDYSDYSMISTDILGLVDVYIKCAPPCVELPSKVLNVGIPAHDYRLLAMARQLVMQQSVPKTIDVYGRFGAWTDSQPLRTIIVDTLKRSPLRFTGGFGIRNYRTYLTELMRAKIAIDLPGQGAWSYRLVEAMALGSVVVTPEPTVSFPEALTNGIHYIAIGNDGSNVVEVCQELLKDQTRRVRIAKEAHIFFDRNFSPQSKIRRILRRTVIGHGNVNHVALVNDNVNS